MKNSPPPAEKKKRQKRTAGRPAEGRTVGHSKIIEAVLVLLRTQQPQELTIAAVAARAGVDPALVRYYFGDKKQLIKATAVHLLDDIQERSQSVLSETGSLRQRIRKRLVLLLDALRDNPRFLQLVLNEVYGDTEDAEALNQVAHRGMALTQVLLKAPAGQKATRPIDPRYLHVAILGMCTFFMDAQPLLAVLFNGQDEERVLDGYIDFATEFLARGLEAS